ncbi:TetR/AcrR family transcriptional regulator [Geomicrobium sp. JSM 1781026]|uniref:TetR/AcrR family transcriptional regulator n=1 Tax=Geomicrobium sp. JSM 1781026 TaxID=3344580 RepID=UPI0035C0ACB1
MDRRKKYTRRVLAESLIGLLKDKPVASVTVKELCEAADVNRSTFYSHFNDPYDLLNQIGEKFESDLYETLHQYDFAEEEEELLMTEKIFEYIEEQRELCIVLLSSHGDVTFKRRVMEVAKDYVLGRWNVERQANIPEYIPRLMISGTIDVIEHWLKDERHESPKELAAMLHQFKNYGLRSFS